MSQNLEWMNRLARVECRDSTYKPKTSPLVFAKALGSLIWDVEGKEYVDLCAGFGALPLGHNSVALKNTLEAFAEETPVIEHAMGDVYPSREKVLFLETLQRMLPNVYSKGALALSGGQAVEISLKTAMLATKKFGFIVFDEGYHGLDLGVLPLTAREDFRSPFKAWIAEDHIVRLPYGASNEELNAAANLLRDRGGLAAVVAEPVQGRAGVKAAPQNWLKNLADFAHNQHALLVLDEIFTGFGRIGSITSAEEVDADILCFGKAIGGGFPISACFAKEAVMNAWPESPGEALHTGTFFGHAFSAAVGRRTMEEIAKQNLCARAINLGEQTKAWLRDKLQNNERVKDIRGVGLMLAIEFYEAGYAARLMDELRPMGVIVLPSGATGATLSITPALNISEDLLRKALVQLVAVIS